MLVHAADELDGDPREELNLIERNSAYGTQASAHPNGQEGHFEVKIAALTDRALDVYLDDEGNAVAETVIAGEQSMRLQRVYVHCITSWGLPKVEYIELFGCHPDTQEEVYEKKVNK